MFYRNEYFRHNKILNLIASFFAEIWHMGSGVIIETALASSIVVIAFFITAVLWFLI